MSLWWAELRFGKPRSSLQRERVVTFCIVQKVTKKHAGLRPATSIQSSAGNTFREVSDGTSRNRFFAQNGGEKALNRCEVRVLQRKELERRLKEKPCSLRTVGYGWVGMRDGGRKSLAFEDSKARLVRKKSFWFVKKAAFSVYARPLGEEKLLLANKVGVFSSCKTTR